MKQLEKIAGLIDAVDKVVPGAGKKDRMGRKQSVRYIPGNLKDSAGRGLKSLSKKLSLKKKKK